MSVIVGVLVLWFSTSIAITAWATFWAGISATVITIGIVGILYDAILRRALIRDIQSVSQLDARIVNAGITHATLERDSISQREVFSSAKTLDIVPLEPLNWQDMNFAWLTQLANEKRVQCRIYLPEPTAYSEILKLASSSDPTLTSAGVCSATFKQFTKSWKGAVHSKSTLEVLFYQGFPKIGFVLGDRAALIEIGNHGATATDLSLVYSGPTSGATLEWLRTEVDGLSAESVEGSSPQLRTPEEILPLSPSSAPLGLESARSTSLEEPYVEVPGGS